MELPDVRRIFGVKHPDGAELVVHGGHIHAASVNVPGDKSISHRALLFGLLAQGTSRIQGLSRADDVNATRAAVASLGAKLDESEYELSITGTGGSLTEPDHVINVGNSGTLLRLISGLLAPRVGVTVFLTGDASIVRRPMARVVEPLTAMGAYILGRQENRFAPLVVQGRELTGITYSMSTPSAQVKSAIILAGLAADGETAIIESTPTRAHTEEMAPLFGARLQVEDDGASRVVHVERSDLSACDFVVPGDPSAAAFFVVLGLIGESPVTVDNVYLGAERDGFVKVLRAMGGRIEVSRLPSGAHSITARPSELTGTVVGPEGVPGLIDEVPILAVAAAKARGATTFLGVEELRHKESDRIATTMEMLAAFGVESAEVESGFRVWGGVPVDLARHMQRSVDSHMDHRIAMSAAILGAVSKAETRIVGADSVPTSFPGFSAQLARCGVEVRA